MFAERIFLLLLVLAEDANFFDVAIQEMTGNCSSETIGRFGEEFVFEDWIIIFCFVYLLRLRLLAYLYIVVCKDAMLSWRI